MVEKFSMYKLSQLIEDISWCKYEIIQIRALNLAVAQSCEINSVASEEYAPALYAIYDKIGDLLEKVTEIGDKTTDYLYISNDFYS